jgi:hypothetical protein
MKKIISFPIRILLLAAIFILPSCAKEDTTPPVLQLLPIPGGNMIAQPLPSVKGTGKWIDPGFIVTDNVDKDLFSKVHVFGSIDPNTKGTYTLTYSVKDAAGNITTQTRTVLVYNDADSLAGVYSVVDSTISPTFAVTGYTILLKSDLYTDSLVHFDRFAGLNNDSTVTGMLNHAKNILKVQTQQVTFWPVSPSMPETHTFSGSGTDSVGALIPTVIKFNYTDLSSTTGILTVHHTRWSK